MSQPGGKVKEAEDEMGEMLIETRPDDPETVAENLDMLNN